MKREDTPCNKGHAAEDIEDVIGADKAKVVDFVDMTAEETVCAIEKNGKLVMCRCWRSKKFPYCDGSHVAHNKKTGDNVGPLIVTNGK